MSTHPRLSTGVEGLDAVLDGGLLPERAYMIRGQPGTGKTILGLQFLTAGEEDEQTLCINFEESIADIEQNAASLNIDVSDVDFLDLSPDADVFTENRSYDVFTPDEVESTSVSEAIIDAVDEHHPDRVLVDPVTQLRHFTPDEYQFRKEVASFMSYLTAKGATVLYTTQPTESAPDDDLQFICDGTIELGYENKGRVVSVTKFRGSDFDSGSHTIRIEEGGLQVSPVLVPEQYRKEFTPGQISSGIPEVDSLLGGGLERGTVTVISGPSGVGKTTTGTQIMQEAARRGERSVVYLFEETRGTFVHRSEQIGIPVTEMEREGRLYIEEVEPLSISSDEFAHEVRRQVEEYDASVVMIDGISGFQLAMLGDEEDLVRELHSVCRYLKNMGVTTILVDDVQSVTGEIQVTSSNISYLGDNIAFLRYLEIDGELRKAIGVLKKRASDFERSLREFEITDDGLVIGSPLTELRGMLSGAPTLTDPEEDD